MGTLACILGLLLIGGAGEEHWTEPAAVTAALRDAVVRVPMDHANRRIEIPVRIDGQGPYLFQLDTGSEAAVVLDPDLAATLRSASIGVPVNEADSAVVADTHDPRTDPGAAQAAADSQLTLGSLGLGEAEFLDVTAVVRPLATPGVRGVLGLPLFESLLLTIDYAGSELVLSRGSLPRDALDVFPLLGSGAVPHVPLQVGGQVWSASIDTGDPENVTFPTSSSGDLRTRRRPVILAGDAGASTPQVRGARLADTLLVAGRSYQQLPVLFAEDATEPRLGYGLLTHYVLTFDQRQRLVRFGLSAPSEVSAQERPARLPSDPTGAGAWTPMHSAVSSLTR
jgi:hypothetical protein